jgi:hypothetical protein
MVTLPAWLKTGTTVAYRRGRAGREDVDWGPWKTGVLEVQPRAADVPRSRRRSVSFWKKGEPSTVGITGMIDWAEYTADDICDNDDTPSRVTLLAEDYYLELAEHVSQ